MSKLSFGWKGPGSLRTALSRPILRSSLELSDQRRPIAFNLWHSGETGLRIESEMHDVGDRLEVGVLQFSYLYAIGSSEIAAIDCDSEVTVALVKLIVRESEIEAESGLVIIAGNGDELIVVAGVYPYSLAVSGVASVPHSFEPEYRIDQYVREAW